MRNTNPWMLTWNPAYFISGTTTGSQTQYRRDICQYGDRCKFLHVSQNQSKSNPFGFGTQNTSQATQQQKPNPFGFGVQNSSQSKGTPNFNTGYQSSAKPFENTWARSSSNSTPSQKTDTQPQAVNHNCTDPNLCKRIFAEDFKNEAPLWKLTCYGHFKYLPCDIVGDTSFEELRAAAYEDGKRGLNLQAIVEKERILLNSKLLEFDNLLKNPYVPRSLSSAGAPGTNSVLSFPSVQSNAPASFPAVQSNVPAFFPAVQSNVPAFFPAVQSNTLTSFPSVQSNAPKPFTSFNQPGGSNSSVLDIRNHSPVTPSGTGFGQPSFPQNTSQTSHGAFSFGVPGVSGNSSATSFNNANASTGNKGFSFPSSQQFPSISNQPLSFHDEKEQDDGSDHSIWLKEEWDIGEIPDREPPSRFC